MVASAVRVLDSLLAGKGLGLAYSAGRVGGGNGAELVVGESQDCAVETVFNVVQGGLWWKGAGIDGSPGAAFASAVC